MFGGEEPKLVGEGGGGEVALAGGDTRAQKREHGDLEDSLC